MATIPDIVPVVIPADHVAGPPQGKWTYADYAALPDDGQRYEIVEGVLYMMPSPGERHQTAITLFITNLTLNVQMTGMGRVYPAPFDVDLAPGTTVQPDVIVVLKDNSSIITPANIVGAPDLVVEIASPSTATHDRCRKLRAYENAGVREYWIADPSAHTIELLALDAGRYRTVGVFQGRAQLPSVVLAGLPVRVEQFFD